MRKQVGSSRKVDPLLVKEADFLRFFSKLSPSERKKLIHKLTSPQIRCLSEIFSNFLKQNLTRNPAIIKRLKRYKDSIRAVALKKTSLLKKKSIKLLLKKCELYQMRQRAAVHRAQEMNT